jgi:ATP-dependent DNA helicase DinG
MASEADRRELAGSLSASQQLLEAAQILSGLPAQGGCFFATAQLGDWALRAQPTVLSRQLARLEAGRGALVLTSDALSTQSNRPWVLERLGLSGPGTTEPITFVPGKLHRGAAHPLVVLVTDAPNPREEAFLDWTAARISGLASFTRGGVLGIFSSKARLVQIAERVRQNLEPIGIQVVRETSRGMRVRNGRNAAGMVRLGGRGWWLEPQLSLAGIRCAFMDKLPIESSSNPLVAARDSDHASAGGQRGFVHYRLPRALVLLRQAIQRLNCWPSEVEVIVLASPGSRSYRDQVLAALDGQRGEVLPWSAARIRIHQELNGARPDRDPLTLPAA